jgi:hypothetical protein
MTGKAVQNHVPTLAELREKIDTGYIAVPFDHPAGYGPHEVSKLKRREYRHITEAVRLPNGAFDYELQDRMAVAYGLVSPKLSTASDPDKAFAEAMAFLEECPNDYIQPIATKVWAVTNDYRDKEAKEGAGADVTPFTKRSSSASDLPAPPDDSSPKSTP